MEEPTLHKTVIFIPKTDHNQLKAKLALEGSNVSEWFRELVNQKIGKTQTKESSPITD